MDRYSIALVSYGLFEPRLLQNLAASVKSQFGVPVSFQSRFADLSVFFDPARRQYDANQLIKIIALQDVPDPVKTIGLFQVDLFIPILTFIFGQAVYKGKIALASTYRLKNELYGLPANETLLFERFRKVVIHELGHTFGLIHCHVPSCVMRSSTYVEEIDLKKNQFCPRCYGELQKLI